MTLWSLLANSISTGRRETITHPSLRSRCTFLRDLNYRRRCKRVQRALKFQQDSKKCCSKFSNENLAKGNISNEDEVELANISMRITSLCQLKRKDRSLRITVAMVTSNKIYFCFLKRYYYYSLLLAYVK